MADSEQKIVYVVGGAGRHVLMSQILATVCSSALVPQQAPKAPAHGMDIPSGVSRQQRRWLTRKGGGKAMIR